MNASTIARPLDGVLSVVLAPQCAACDAVLDAPLDGPVCATCWRGVQRVATQDVAAIEPLDAWRAAGEYEGSLREIVHAFKYDGRRSLAARLAAMMREDGEALLTA